MEKISMITMTRFNQHPDDDDDDAGDYDGADCDDDGG